MDPILKRKGFPEGVPLEAHVGSKLSCLLSIFVGAMLGASCLTLPHNMLVPNLTNLLKQELEQHQASCWDANFMDPILGRNKGSLVGIPVGVHVGSKVSCLLSMCIGTMLGACFGY
jgi:hypothetical protein